MSAMRAIIATLIAPASASTFLGAHPHAVRESMPTKEVEQAFLEELSALGGKGDQIHLIESELQSLFTAMPKNTKGKLDSNVVRYALHRYFSHKYGWHLRGLEVAGSAWNSSSPAKIDKDMAPSYVQSLMEAKTNGEGLGLSELAILAATLSDLIRQEAASDLEAVLSKWGYDTEDMMTSERVDTVLKMYLMTYIKGMHAEKKIDESFRHMEQDLAASCISWFDAKDWVKDLRYTLDFTLGAARNPFKTGYRFDAVAEAAQEMGHRFGSFQNLECQTLKDMLVEMEHEGSGRVALTKFYSGVDDWDWPFIESSEYLRNLGALDETDPNGPSVIIPNFLSSPSNCIAGSSFYSVCCTDECEGLFAHVERLAGEPTSTAGRLSEIISHLGSDTVEAPRTLGSVQLDRLNEIASLHGGRVPLHGRLFAQWMHHVYPRECRFPHVAGTTNPLNQEDFAKEFGMDYAISDEEISLFKNKTFALLETEAVSLPWHETEELLAAHGRGGADHHAQPRTSAMRAFACLVAVAAFALPLARTSRTLITLSDTSEKHLV